MTTTASLEARGIKEPYVGPRPFKGGETLFGRATDCDNVISLLNSERIVLLHAPSGAGKSSLLNAGIIPKLRDSYFAPFGPVALGHLPSTKVNEKSFKNYTQTSLVNRALVSLNATLAKEKRCSENQLAEMTLMEFYKSHIRERKWKSQEKQASKEGLGGEERLEPEFFPVIIFDQFEEIFDEGFDESASEENRRELFQQLRELLLRKEVFALFAIREDFLGRIEPRSNSFPGNLRARYRLDLLKHDQALEAIYEPFARYYRKEKIQEDSTTISKSANKNWSSLLVQRLQQSRDPISGRYKQGQYVEPVLLQVVCKYIWNTSRRSPEPAPTEQNFTEAAMRAVTQDKDQNTNKTGLFDDAIGGFYEDVVRKAVEDGGLDERRIRDWIGTNLITEHMRSQVNFGPTRSEDDVQVLRVLQDEHLIRQDTRGDTTWYELVHDRLVEPILESNRKWELSLPESERFLKVSADKWKDRSFSNTYLLRGRALVDAERWAAQQGNRITDIEARFLRESRRERIWVQGRKLLTAAATVGILAFSFTLIRLREMRKTTLSAIVTANLAKAAAQSEQVSAIQAQEKSQQLLLDAEAAQAVAKTKTEEANRLKEGIKESDARAKAATAENSRTQLQLSAKEKQLDIQQVASNLKDVQLRREASELNESKAETGALNAQANARLLASEAIRQIDEHTKSKTFALISALQKMVEQYAIVDPYAMSQVPSLLQASLVFRTIAHNGAGLDLGYHAQNHEIILARPEGVLARAHVDTGSLIDTRFLRLCMEKKKSRLLVLDDSDSAFSKLNSCDGVDVPSSLAISPNGDSILAGFVSGEVFLWNWTDQTTEKIPAGHYQQMIIGSTFDHIGDIAVSVTALGSFSVTRLRPTIKHIYHQPTWIGWYKILALNQRTEFVRTAAFVGNNPEVLAVGLDDGGLELWSVRQPRRRTPPEKTQTGGILSISSNGEGTQLALTGNSPGVEFWTITKGSDGSLKLNELNQNFKNRIPQGKLPRAQANSITTMAMAYCSAYRPDGKVVAAGKADGRISFWNASSGSEIADFPGHEGRVNSVIFLSNDLMVSTGEDGRTRIWQVPSDDRLRSLKELRDSLRGFLPKEVSLEGPPAKLSDIDRANLLNLLSQAAAFLMANPDVTRMP
jgi:hypothetical protein